MGPLGGDGRQGKGGDLDGCRGSHLGNCGVGGEAHGSKIYFNDQAECNRIEKSEMDGSWPKAASTADGNLMRVSVRFGSAVGFVVLQCFLIGEKVKGGHSHNFLHKKGNEVTEKGGS